MHRPRRVIAVIGVIPYISLQLKAISGSFVILRNYPHVVMPSQARESATYCRSLPRSACSLR